MKLAGTYLTFQGNCKKAMTFYAKVFGVEINAEMPWSDSQAPGVLPKDFEGIMHMSLMLDDGTSIMACDYNPAMCNQAFNGGNNVQIVLEPSSKEETNRLFESLKEGGSDAMPPQDMWWGSYHGSCTDRFGIRWMFDMSTFSSEEAKMKQNLMGAVGALRVSAKIANSTAAKLEALIEEPVCKKAKFDGNDEKKMDTAST